MLLKRAGVDPVTVDKRSLGEIMNDSIPYEKWENDRIAARDKKSPRRASTRLVGKVGS